MDLCVSPEELEEFPEEEASTLSNQPKQLKFPFTDKVNFRIPKKKTGIKYCIKHHSTLCKVCSLIRRAQRDKIIHTRIFNQTKDLVLPSPNNNLQLTETAELKPSENNLEISNNKSNLKQTSKSAFPVNTLRTPIHNQEPLAVKPTIVAQAKPLSPTPTTRTRNCQGRKSYICKYCGCCCCPRDKQYLKAKQHRGRRPYKVFTQPPSFQTQLNIPPFNTIQTQAIPKLLDLPLIVPRHYRHF